ncbi:unnamed protein product [Polarella glacialis]|uniref:Uncharacterized protein n=1 Tax=Polarella glacialis TaxID=89957 RepID=A0A813D3X3_POLGL|nr:unnamed protein product [Polarella glacialis]
MAQPAHLTTQQNKQQQQKQQPNNNKTATTQQHQQEQQNQQNNNNSDKNNNSNSSTQLMDGLVVHSPRSTNNFSTVRSYPVRGGAPNLRIPPVACSACKSASKTGCNCFCTEKLTLDVPSRYAGAQRATLTCSNNSSGSVVSFACCIKTALSPSLASVSAAAATIAAHQTNKNGGVVTGVFDFCLRAWYSRPASTIAVATGCCVGTITVLNKHASCCRTLPAVVRPSLADATVSLSGPVHGSWTLTFLGCCFPTEGGCFLRPKI